MLLLPLTLPWPLTQPLRLLPHPSLSLVLPLHLPPPLRLILSLHLPLLLRLTLSLHLHPSPSRLVLRSPSLPLFRALSRSPSLLRPHPLP